MQNNLF